MSGGVVCYVERTPGGSAIKRLRLTAAGLSRTWTAPEGRSVSSIDGGAVAAARAGAAWIAETLEAVGLKRLAALCIDSEGSICAWISSTSAEPSVVRATIVQSVVDGDGSGAGVGAARLLADGGAGGGGGSGGGGVGVDTSVQALATLEPRENGRALSMRKKAPAELPRKQRLAVLAVQDAVARVLLDELDERGIETERVVSLWHAMAGAWDRSQAASMSDRLLSAQSPGGAVILVEPTGRLVWAWTRAGELVAGGTMRLATRARRIDNPQSDALAAPEGGATRRTVVDAEPADTALSVDFTAADAGRLAVDWLSWSAQLGHCPERVVCLAVPGLGDPEAGGGGGMGPEALFANLAKTWPGATVDGAVHEDPVAATMARMAGLGPEERKALPDATQDELPYHARPREALSDLTARPGRADRRLHQWIGISLCAAAGLVGVLGWKLHQSAGLAQAQLDLAKKDRTEAMTSAAATAQVANLGPKPLEALEAALKKVREQNKALKPPRPILPEAVRVLAAVREVEAAMREAHAAAPAPTAGEPAPTADKKDNAPSPAPGTPTAPGSPIAPGSPLAPGADAAPPTLTPRIVMTELEVSPVAGKAMFIVPDSATGPSILEKVQGKPGVMRWEGSTSGGTMNSARTYALLAVWPPDDAKPAPAATPAAAAPAPAATPAPKPPAATTAPTPAPAKPADAPHDAKKPEDKKPVEAIPGATANPPLPHPPTPAHSPTPAAPAAGEKKS